MFFVLPLPPGLNATYGTNKSGNFYKKTIAKDWETEAGWIIKSQKNRKLLTKQCSVRILVCFDPVHEPDIDAYIKITLDRLEKCGIIKNDKLIWDLTVKKFLDPGSPRLEVTITS